MSEGLPNQNRLQTTVTIDSEGKSKARLLSDQRRFNNLDFRSTRQLLLLRFGALAHAPLYCRRSHNLWLLLMISYYSLLGNPD